MVSAGATVATDEQLVKAAREGSDAAFEALVRRYRERITTYVRGMVHDGSRAEDITQETFISALRSLRASDQEIAFRPWVFQIARNACIDHLRKVRRNEEISIYSEDFQPDYEVRISGPQATDAAVIQRQDLDYLRQAFGGLPDSQHEILLLREFEGLSYQEIGQRMGLTAPAVESMLARARRSLKGQYDEIATGERCRRMRPVITAVATGFAGKRDRRTLERHLRYCRYCRHDAIASGLEELVVGARENRASRVISRAAALFPFPWLLRRRGSSAADTVSSSSFSTGAQIHISHISALSPVATEQAGSALQKAVAIVAVATVASGGGLVAKEAGVGVPLPKVSAKKEAKVEASTKRNTDSALPVVEHPKKMQSASVRAIEESAPTTTPAGPGPAAVSAPVLGPATTSQPEPAPAPPAQDQSKPDSGANTDASTPDPASGPSDVDAAPADTGDVPPAAAPQDVLPPDPGVPIDGAVVPPDVTAPAPLPPDPASGGVSDSVSGGPGSAGSDVPAVHELPPVS
jgi:RNA polymerase sigma factor (sigma-70 family)